MNDNDGGPGFALLAMLFGGLLIVWAFIALVAVGWLTYTCCDWALETLRQALHSGGTA